MQHQETSRRELVWSCILFVFPVEIHCCALIHVYVEIFDPAAEYFQVAVLHPNCRNVGNFMCHSFRGFRGFEDNLLSLLSDGTTSTKSTDNLDCYYHGVLQKFLLYLIETDEWTSVPRTFKQQWRTLTWIREAKTDSKHIPGHITIDSGCGPGFCFLSWILSLPPV